MKHRPFGRTGKTDVATAPDRSCAITHSFSPRTPTSTASAASPVGVRDAVTSTAAGANPAADRLSRTCAVLGWGADATSACSAASTAAETPDGTAGGAPVASGEAESVAGPPAAGVLTAEPVAGAGLGATVGAGAEHAAIPITNGSTRAASPA